ncbi:predicted protein [Plenodomus lingam JN3]|uniref:Predicted protein n=1 Tax=Leptosphaeria maculans (strain JN3 / isolate v23.1.3 / race Av1-4-5-6-7-8) TaxID=985895 RepID=E4ZV07_LEPMJ|nr:predicted protein [Plenodomus lingam JN3]CBX95433.1 predicted protein [Plenodomus lingam JN3]
MFVPSRCYMLPAYRLPAMASSLSPGLLFLLLHLLSLPVSTVLPCALFVTF